MMNKKIAESIFLITRFLRNENDFVLNKFKLKQENISNIIKFIDEGKIKSTKEVEQLYQELKKVKLIEGYTRITHEFEIEQIKTNLIEYILKNAEVKKIKVKFLSTVIYIKYCNQELKIILDTKKIRFEDVSYIFVPMINYGIQSETKQTNIIIALKEEIKLSTINEINKNTIILIEKLLNPITKLKVGIRIKGEK